MRKRILITLYSLIMIVGLIFMLKTIYIFAIKFIYVNTFSVITGTIIASIMSIFVCLILVNFGLENLIKINKNIE